jgi:DNA-directed RNA polymerase II subunit RPB1
MTTVADLNHPFSAAPLKRVKAVRFTVFGPDDVRNGSVCKVEKVQIYDGGVPIRGGINDARMGAPDIRAVCETCSMGYDHCAGHFGHIELAKPMFNWGFLKMVVRVLRSVCYYTSNLKKSLIFGVKRDEPKIKFKLTY